MACRSPRLPIPRVAPPLAPTPRPAAPAVPPEPSPAPSRPPLQGRRRGPGEALERGDFRRRADGRWETLTPTGALVELCALRYHVIEQGQTITVEPAIRWLDARLGPVEMRLERGLWR